MRLEERRIEVHHLRAGMYVCRLDRDWVDTPFPLQGLMVHGADDIVALAEYCTHVYVDIALGIDPDEPPQTLARRLPIRPQYTPAQIEELSGSVAWPNVVDFSDEVPRAREAQHEVAEFAGRILDDVRNGRAISAEDVRSAVEPMVRSILRNVDAFLWIESLRKRDDYDYTHALNCSALAAAFGRHVGFPEDVLTDIASGALLLDVGKLRVDEELFQRKGPLTHDEIAQVRSHVEHGLALIEASSALPAHVADMIRTHHEREDGSGYPQGLSGTQIPLLGRIASVVDSYDAMISTRSYRKAISRHDALQELYRERNTRYAPEIVEQFMQCLSVYPTGSLVLLNDGRVAVVMAQNSARRLRPRIMVLTTPDKTPANPFVTMDLMLQGDATGVRIVDTLQPGAYGMDPTELYL